MYDIVLEICLTVLEYHLRDMLNRPGVVWYCPGYLLNHPSSSHIGRQYSNFLLISPEVLTPVSMCRCSACQGRGFISELRIHMRYNRRCIDMLGKCLHQLLHHSSPLQHPVAIWPVLTIASQLSDLSLYYCCLGEKVFDSTSYFLTFTTASSLSITKRIASISAYCFLLQEFWQHLAVWLPSSQHIVPL